MCSREGPWKENQKGVGNGDRSGRWAEGGGKGRGRGDRKRMRKCQFIELMWSRSNLKKQKMTVALSSSSRLPLLPLFPSSSPICFSSFALGFTVASLLWLPFVALVFACFELESKKM